MDMIKRQNIESNERVVSENKKWESQQRDAYPPRKARFSKRNVVTMNAMRLVGASLLREYGTDTGSTTQNTSL
jgi:hypothetical protein